MMLAAAAAVAVAAAVVAAAADRFFIMGDGTLALVSVHTGAKASVTYRRPDGTYDPAALAEIRRVMRSRDGGEGEISLRLVELLAHVHAERGKQPLRIQSGYFGLRNNDAWIAELLHHLDLTGKADSNMRSLSGGMKRRVLVGQALVHKPPVIVLDEPTAGVDVELRQSLWSFIRKLNRDGHTIILTTHYLEEAEALCQRIAMMKAGRIVALDTTHNLLSRFAGLTVRVAASHLPPGWEKRELRREGNVHYVGLVSYGELERLLADLRVAQIHIDELALAETDLEQVFLRIMSGTESTDDTRPVVTVPEA